MASAVVPEAVQTRIRSFINWLANYVESTQINQVLDEVVEHVK